MFTQISTFIRQVIKELKLVNIPSRDRTIRMTVVVVSVCTVLGIYIGILDYGLTGLIALVI